LNSDIIRILFRGKYKMTSQIETLLQDAARVKDCDVTRVLTLVMLDHVKRRLEIAEPSGEPMTIPDLIELASLVERLSALLNAPIGRGSFGSGYGMAGGAYANPLGRSTLPDLGEAIRAAQYKQEL
jgi:hypothetical protein